MCDGHIHETVIEAEAATAATSATAAKAATTAASAAATKSANQIKLRIEAHVNLAMTLF